MFAQSTIGREFDDMCCEDSRILGRRQEQVILGAERLTHSRNIGTRYRELGSHILENAVRTTFGIRAEDARIRRLEQARYIVDRAQEANTSIKSQVVGQRLQRFAIRIEAPRQEQHRPRTLLCFQVISDYLPSA